MTAFDAALSNVPGPAAGSEKWTAADYLARTPENPPWHELIDGCLVEEPSAGFDHQSIQGEIFGLLWMWNRKAKRGRIISAPMDLILSRHDVLQPDILFIDARRMAIVKDDRIWGPADLVVEILSPSDSNRTLLQKKSIYGRTGVKEFWRVDPPAETIQVFRFAVDRVNPVQTVGPGDRLTSPLLPGFKLPVADIFRTG